MSRKANRKINRAKRTCTELGLIVTTNGNEITLETRKAPVVNIKRARKNRDLAWLAADVFSTPSGYRA